MEQGYNVLIVKRRVLKGSRYFIIVSLTVLLRRLGFVRNMLEYVPEYVLTTKAICSKTIPMSLNLTYGLSSPLKPVYTYCGLSMNKYFKFIFCTSEFAL